MSVVTKAIPTTGRELKPGDLFSMAGPEFWGAAMEGRSFKKMVFIRTNWPADDFLEADDLVFRIEILLEVEKGGENVPAF